MPAQVILVEAQPARAADGIAETIRLAGGGALAPYTYSGQTDWRAGVVGLPTLIASLEYEGGEFPAGSVPAAAAIEWAPSAKALLSATASYVWADAPITVRIGDEGAALPPVRISGKVLDAKASGGKLTIALADPATGLKKPLLTTRFAGTGGLEGPVEWAGQIRRRIWGQVWNLSGDPIDAANNIYCFADPLRPLLAFDAVRDKGAPAAALTVLAWQGSAAATLAALQAASAPAGGGVVCPSIACVKWWTQPAGELCADLRGEVGAGYVETTAGIAQRLVEAIGGPAFTAGTVAAAAAARPAPVGWVAKDDSTTVAAMLDELLGNSSLLWLLDDNGAITIRPWAWGASVASAVSQDVSRERVLRPLATRKLGYKRNETPMQRGDLAAIVLSSEVAYLDGTPIEALKPAQIGATVGAISGVNLRNNADTVTLGDAQVITNIGTAAAIAGQGSLATANSVDLGSQVNGTLGTSNAAAGLVNSNISIAPNGALSGAGGGAVTISGLGYTGALNATYGARAGTNMYRTDGSTVMTQAELRTAEGAAAGIVGQGALATKSVASWIADISNRPPVDEVYHDFAFASIAAMTGAGHILVNSSVCSIEANGASPGGAALVMGDGTTALGPQMRTPEWIPYNGNDLYEVVFDLEILASDAAAVFYAGVEAQDRAGNNLGQAYNYVAAVNRNQNANLGRKLFKGYLTGFTASGSTGEGTTPETAKGLPDGTFAGLGQGGAVRFRPVLIANYPDKPGQVKLHAVRVTRIPAKLAVKDELFFGDQYLKETTGGAAAILANFKTGLGTAAGIAGQGYFATQNYADWDTRVTGTGKPQNNATVGARVGVNLRNSADTAYLGDVDVVTNYGTAAAITGQGSLATKSAVNLASADVTNKSLANLDGTANTKLTGIEAGATVGGTFGTNLRETAGGAIATVAEFKTSFGTAAAISGQAWAATNGAQAAVSNAYVTGFANQAIDSEFTLGNTCWNESYASGGTWAWDYATWTSWKLLARYNFSAVAGQVLSLGQTTACGLPVWEGDRVECSAITAWSNMDLVELYVGWFTPAGAYVGATLVSYGAMDTRVGGFATVPAGMNIGIAKLVLTMRVAANGYANARMAQPFIRRCSSVQTALTHYNPGPLHERGANVTETRIAAAIAGQGAGATANSLAALDATAAAQLTTAYNGGVQSAAYGETIKRKIGPGGTLALSALVNCDAGGVSGSIRARIESRPYGGSWSTVDTGSGSSTGPGEPGGDSTSGTFTNSTGVEQVFEFRVIEVRTPSGAGGAILASQSYVTG